MNTRAPIIWTVSLFVYLVTVLTTDISLAGFWTDIIFSLVASVFVVRTVFKNKTRRWWLTLTLRTLAVACSVVVFGLLAVTLADPFKWDTLKLRSFYYQPVDQRLFHAYFKPVGAYSGGYGHFWITESPRYFPLIEKRVYYERAVHHDFGTERFEGVPIDNYEVVRAYIKEEVIDKGR